MKNIYRAFAFALLGIWLSAGVGRASSDPFWQRVQWTTPDGVILIGEYHAASRTGAWTWVLLHGLGSIKGEWDTFAVALAAQGDGVLAYDARGHAESIRRSDGSAIDYRTWPQGDLSGWKAMTDDLGSAVRELKHQFSVNSKHIAVGGASLGANVALVYASQHSDVPALLLLSPGLSYAGIETPEAFQSYGKRPVFLAASPDDTYAFASVGQLARTRGDSGCAVAQGPGAEHGVNMFKSKEFMNRVLGWMRSVEK